MPLLTLRSGRSSCLVLLVANLLLACSGDSAPGTADGGVDGGTTMPEADAGDAASPGMLEAGTADDAAPADAGDAGPVPAQRADGGDPSNEVLTKTACDLLTVDEVAAVLGGPVKATALAGNQQCEFASTDPDRLDRRGLLEQTTNGKAIYDANLANFASRNLTSEPVTGLGDRAAFVSDGPVRSSIQAAVGDLLLRINLGWADPGVSTDTQRAGEKTLMGAVLGRL